MSDPDAIRQELDDWRDLTNSMGWRRLLETYEHQWGDASLVRTLEILTTADAKGDVAAEAKRLLELRVAMRQFLHHPTTRIQQLQQQRDTAEREQAKPWTRQA